MQECKHNGKRFDARGSTQGLVQRNQGTLWHHQITGQHRTNQITGQQTGHDLQSILHPDLELEDHDLSEKNKSSIC